MLSGARALNGDHIYTLASVNANAAVIKGVLKQNKGEQLTVSGTTSISADFDEAVEQCQRTAESDQHKGSNDHGKHQISEESAERKEQNAAQRHAWCLAFHWASLVVEMMEPWMLRIRKMRVNVSDCSMWWFNVCLTSAKSGCCETLTLGCFGPWLPNRLGKELEAAELKYQLAIQRHEDEVADLPLGWKSAVISF
eukprot:Skav236746  [mRNA]  locus=scaffold2899:59027:61587:- [translate_table: standard]